MHIDDILIASKTFEDHESEAFKSRLRAIVQSRVALKANQVSFSS